jgi:hypothetical protein
LLLDEQGDQIFGMTDVLAERVRSIGGTTLRSISHVTRLRRIKDNEEDFVAPIDMLRELMEDNKTFAVNMRETHEVASENNDVATASILENFIDETEKRTWFLFEASRVINGRNDQARRQFPLTGGPSSAGWPACKLMDGYRRLTRRPHHVIYSPEAVLQKSCRQHP